MKAKVLLAAAMAAVLCLSLAAGGCGPGGGAAGKALRQWQQQNR